MDTIQKYVQLGLIALLSLTAIGLGYITMQKSLKNTSIDNCIRVATVEKRNGDQTVKTPENYWYTFCMKEKGYK